MKRTIFLLIGLLFLSGCEIREKILPVTIADLVSTITTNTHEKTTYRKGCDPIKSGIEHSTSVSHTVTFSIVLGPHDVRIDAPVDEALYNELLEKETIEAKIWVDDDFGFNCYGDLELYYHGGLIATKRLDTAVIEDIFEQDLLPRSQSIWRVVADSFYYCWYIWIAMIILDVAVFVGTADGRGSTHDLYVWAVLCAIKRHKANMEKERLKKFNALSIGEMASLIDKGENDYNEIKSEEKRKAVMQYVKNMHASCLEIQG